MKQIDTLDRTIGNARTRIIAEHQRAGEAQQKREREEAMYAATELKMISEKNSMTKEVLSWGNDFAASIRYKDITTILQTPHVNIYNGGWGHKHVEQSHGCWSRVFLLPDGIIQYSAAYKWMDSELLHFRTSEAMAEKLRFDFLKGLHSHITGGDVYKQLAKMLSGER